MGNSESDQVKTARINIYGGIIIAAITLIGTLAGIFGKQLFQPKETPTPVQIDYSGYVYEDGSNAPMKAITVSLELQGGDKKEVITDSEGKYLFDLTVTSRVAGKLIVNVEGYHPFDRNVSIPAEHTSEKDIFLAPLSSPEPATETPAPTVTIAPPTETVPTEAVPTDAPTQPPAPAVKTLAEGCISTQTWKYDSSQADVKNSVSESDGCYSTGQLGIFTDSSGVLNILLEQNKTRNSIASGIYTAASLPNPATIEFTVTVKNMYMVPPAMTPTYITFSIASASDPMNVKQTARFKFQVNDLQDNSVYAKIAQSGSGDGVTVKKGKKFTYPTTTYTLVVDGKAMNVYTGSGDSRIKLSTSDVALPVGPYVLYIGYELPVGASIDADITNIKINGQAQ